MSAKNVLNVTNGAELLSYIINQNPILSAEIDLPKQGESIRPIGELIMSNQRYKNAFINAINLVGLIVISRNGYEDPWYFTEKGGLSFGESVAEMFVDMADVFDYNDSVNNPTGFLSTQIPNILEYVHDLNYQKYYKASISDNQIRMAFTSDTGLFDLVDAVMGSIWTGYNYDKYITKKYMLCRRIVDGTVTPVEIANYDALTPRERVTAIKTVSNNMVFMSPNYNPAGAYRATPFNEQMLIINTSLEAEISTEVLATSYFANMAELKSSAYMVDDFSNHDSNRLTKLLGTAYKPFTEDELTQLKEVPCVIMAREWWKVYNYALDGEADVLQTEFYNPETIARTNWLHTWKVMSTSPFEQCAVIVKSKPSVSAVTVSPANSTVSAGLTVQLSAVVTTDEFANKSVVWSVTEGEGVTVTPNGLVTIPADYDKETNPTVTITATSIYDSEVTATATITVA